VQRGPEGVRQLIADYRRLKRGAKKDERKRTEVTL
jgi:hypothetical protein